MTKEPDDMEDQTPVLVVTPHADDAEIGAGGTIARMCAEGRKVVLVVCTNGDKGTGDRSIKPEDLARTREREQLKSADVLGLSEVVFLRYPDQNLEDTPEFRERIVRQIRIHRPGTVLTVDPYRKYIRHRDHFVVGRVTLDAVFPYARDHLAYPEHLEEGLEPHKVKEVYLWSSEEADTYLDVTDTFQTKMDALSQHESQMGVVKRQREEKARQRFSEAGKQIGVPLAEPFKHIEVL